MCRNIKTLFNFDPPATEEEIRASALQYVRKLSGTTKPSQRNSEAFEKAVEQVTVVIRDLLATLETSRPHRNREEEQAKTRLRAAKHFA